MHVFVYTSVITVCTALGYIVNYSLCKLSNHCVKCTRSKNVNLNIPLADLRVLEGSVLNCGQSIPPTVLIHI